MILSPQAYFIEAFRTFRDGRACLLGTWSIPRETTPREQVLTQACVCCSACVRSDTKSIKFRLIFVLKL